MLSRSFFVRHVDLLAEPEEVAFAHPEPVLGFPARARDRGVGFRGPGVLGFHHHIHPPVADRHRADVHVAQAEDPPQRAFGLLREIRVVRVARFEKQLIANGVVPGGKMQMVDEPVQTLVFRGDARVENGPPQNIDPGDAVAPEGRGRGGRGGGESQRQAQKRGQSGAGEGPTGFHGLSV